MKLETIIGLAMTELSRSEEITPDWPEDVIPAAALVGADAGSLLRAASTGIDPVIQTHQITAEAIRTIATAIRFMKNLKENTNYA